MAAAAVAAGLALGVVGEPSDPAGAAATLGLATLGGLVEGLAVGLFQHAVLHPWLTELTRRRWVGATVAVAVAGWFLGMLPSTLISLNGAGEDATGTTSDLGPPLWVMPFVGVVVGLFAGAVFGAAQAWALRGHVARPRVWIGANALGWAGAMAVIFTGAALPGTGWSLPSLLLLGAVTGVMAGLVIGAVTGLFLPALDDTAPRATSLGNRIVLFVLRSPAHRLLSGSLVELRYVGARSGRRFALPAQYARTGDRLVLYPGHAERKVWWRNFRTSAEVEVVLAGGVRPGVGRLLARDDPERTSALSEYGRRWPRVTVPVDAPLVDVRLR